MIYLIQAEGVGHVKIGFVTGNSASGRFAELQVGSSVPLRLLGTLPGGRDKERELHQRFKHARVRGEWFKPSRELLMLCTATGCPAFDRLAALEPRLRALLAEARCHHGRGGPDFCANEVWYGRGVLRLKERLCKLVGSDRLKPPAELATSEAYDVAYDMIYDALPDCGHEGLCQRVNAGL